MNGGFAAGLLILVQEVDGIAAAKPDPDGVDVVGKGGDDRCIVLLADRHPEAVGDLAAGRTKFGQKAEDHGVRKGVVFAEGGDAFVALFLDHVGAEPRHPLRAVGREPEEVVGGITQGGVLRRRRTVDEGGLRLELCIVLHGQALGAGERPDEDGDLVLLHQLSCSADGAIGAGIR